MASFAYNPTVHYCFEITCFDLALGVFSNGLILLFYTEGLAKKNPQTPNKPKQKAQLCLWSVSVLITVSRCKKPVMDANQSLENSKETNSSKIDPESKIYLILSADCISSFLKSLIFPFFLVSAACVTEFICSLATGCFSLKCKVRT